MHFPHRCSAPQLVSSRTASPHHQHSPRRPFFSTTWLQSVYLFRRTGGGLNLAAGSIPCSTTNFKPALSTRCGKTKVGRWRQSPPLLLLLLLLCCGCSCCSPLPDSRRDSPNIPRWHGAYFASGQEYPLRPSEPSLAGVYTHSLTHSLSLSFREPSLFLAPAFCP